MMLALSEGCIDRKRPKPNKQIAEKTIPIRRQPSIAMVCLVVAPHS
jgi:hypothetical protein